MGLPANIQLSIEPCIVIVIFYNILDIKRVLPASPITNVTFQVFQSYDWLLRRRYIIYSHPSRDVFCLYRCSSSPMHISLLGLNIGLTITDDCGLRRSARGHEETVTTVRFMASNFRQEFICVPSGDSRQFSVNGELTLNSGLSETTSDGHPHTHIGGRLKNGFCKKCGIIVI